MSSISENFLYNVSRRNMVWLVETACFKILKKFGQLSCVSFGEMNFLLFL